MADTEGQRSRRSSRAVSRPETPHSQPTTPPLPVTGSSSAQQLSLPSAVDFPVGGPPTSPSPLAIRASNSPSTKRRKSQPKPPVDLHSLDYVAQPDVNLTCLICHCPFDQPRQVTACDHVFCKQCLHQAFEAQQATTKTCPTCRTPVVEKPKEVHRLITSMLDDLVVKCPHQELGCKWTDKRSHVQDHIELYCDYTSVECGDPDCNRQILQKDHHRGCLHVQVECPDCAIRLVKKDFDDHQKDLCEKRLVICDCCEVELPKQALSSHISEVCPKTAIACPGHVCGCTEEGERQIVTKHIEKCVLAKLSPTILRQQAKLDESDASNKLLLRKLDVLEGGMSAIQDLVYAHNPTSNATSANNNAQATDSFPPFSQASTDATNAPPFDSSVHHLLSLQESLREEVSRTTDAMAELDARITLNQLNSEQRIREQFMQLNHAVGSMRTQVHWLVSARLQTRGSTTATNVAAGSSSSGTSAPTNLQPFRRLSDSNRQDPKL